MRNLIKTETHDDIAVIMLNRLEVPNAWIGATRHEIIQQFQDGNADPEMGVVAEA